MKESVLPFSLGLLLSASLFLSATLYGPSVYAVVHSGQCECCCGGECKCGIGNCSCRNCPCPPCKRCREFTKPTGDIN